MWWGQGAHGDLLLTNNAYPLDLVKFSNPEPTLLPWLFRYLGPFKYAAFVAFNLSKVPFGSAGASGVRFRFAFGTFTNFLMDFVSNTFGCMAVPPCFIQQTNDERLLSDC